jgi:hypothetical protein
MGAASRGTTARLTAAICVLLLLLAWAGGWVLLDLSIGWTHAVRPLICFVGLGLATYGLIRRAFWGRWVVLGLSIGGLLHGALLAPFLGPWWFLVVAPYVVLFGSLLLLLAGRSIRARFEGREALRHRWDLSRRPVRLLGWTVVLNVAALPMLLFYSGSTGWWMDGFRRAAGLATLVLLALALALVVMQKTAGLLLFGVVGLAMVWIAGDAIHGALSPAPPELARGGCIMTPREAALAGSLPAIAALLPGAVAAVAAVAAFAGRIRAFLMRPAPRD